MQQHGLAVGKVYRYALNGFSAMVPPGQLAQLRNDPAVLTVEPDLIVHVVSQTIPTGVSRIGTVLNNVAKINGVDERVNVDVAVIDTGVSAHPDLNVFARTDCVDNSLLVVLFGFPATCVDGQGDDGNSHGTHVAGTIGALDNDFGVVGVAPGARIWSVRVLDANGSAYLSWIIAGMDYVTQHASEIEVANMSFGWTGNSSAARTSVQNGVAKGVVFVAAAGNDGVDIYGADGLPGTADDFEPAAYPEVSAISALADSDGVSGGAGPATNYGPDDTLATFSNFSAHVPAGYTITSPGQKIDLAAPGVDILSTYPGGLYALGSGTSMASPHATGAFALYIAANGRATTAAGVNSIRQALIDASQQQSLWGPANTVDPDGFHEGLANVGSGSTPSNLAPAVTIKSPANNASFASGALISFSGTATDDHDGTLTSKLSWSSNKDGVIGSGGSFSKKLSDGVHIITASVTDSAGKVGSSSVTVKVGCVASVAKVTSITYSVTNRKRDLNSIVTLKDDCGKAVVGASISIVLSNSSSPLLIWQATGTTGSTGSETFLLPNAPNGTYKTQVVGVTATGLTWDGAYPSNSYTKR
jgi:hypothetical protein